MHHIIYFRLLRRETLLRGTETYYDRQAARSASFISDFHKASQRNAALLAVSPFHINSHFLTHSCFILHYFHISGPTEFANRYETAEKLWRQSQVPKPRCMCTIHIVTRFTKKKTKQKKAYNIYLDILQTNYWTMVRKVYPEWLEEQREYERRVGWPFCCKIIM